MSNESNAPYRVKGGKEDEFIALLRRHWPTLRDLGLVEGRPSPVYRGTGESGGTVTTGKVLRLNLHGDDEKG